VRIKGEIRTLTAQQRLSGLCRRRHADRSHGPPVRTRPDFMKPLFDNPPGIAGLPAGLIILGIGFFFMFIGFMAIRRIVAIEV